MNRKTIERERRSNMRDLFSRLFSLLPPQPARRSSIPDRLEQATEHINQLRSRLEGLEQRRSQLEEAHRATRTSLTSPVINISEYSNISGMEINLITGSELNLSLSQIIRIIGEEGAQVISLTLSKSGNMNILSIHCQQAAISYINGIDRSRLFQRLITLVQE
ncbi:transcription factor bHLH162-like [Hibiscus syriacus]|uniref:transcription factor bHLH162-like n=1 Tax=Hibiscus syriacus TaxID=106335 RepID=UPI001920780E|nr:transcription factor bHLH162-like [Hibiscus syriacus]